jgi:hypothetical protein
MWVNDKSRVCECVDDNDQKECYFFYFRLGKSIFILPSNDEAICNGTMATRTFSLWNVLQIAIRQRCNVVFCAKK